MYTFNGRVRYSEITKEQTLDLYAILNYFQDCSNFQSADLGVGVQYLTEQKRAWLLCAWQVELVRAPRLFDRITTGTWPYAFQGMYGYRNFILYNESRNHEVAAYANSIWFLIDTQSGKPLRITEEDAAPYALEPAYPMEYAPRKIALPGRSPAHNTQAQPRIPATAASRVPAVNTQAQPQASAASRIPAVNAQAQPPAWIPDTPSENSVSAIPISEHPPITVTKMFLDTNNHVNNARYVQLAQSCLPEDFKIRRMRAEYRRAAVLGDVIFPVLLAGAEEIPGKIFHVLLNDKEGNAYAVVEFAS